MTSIALRNLVAVVAAAKTTLPAESGVTARYQARSGHGPGSRLLLLDTSESMDARTGGRRRIDHLQDALVQVCRPEHTLLAFSSSVSEVRAPADIPSPSGGTALDLALQVAASYRPVRTLVISDGEPNVPQAALKAARVLPGRIDVIFCGDEGNADAIAFMRALAALGCGQVVVHRWGGAGSAADALAAPIRMLLSSK